MYNDYTLEPTKFPTSSQKLPNPNNPDLTNSDTDTNEKKLFDNLSANDAPTAKKELSLDQDSSFEIPDDKKSNLPKGALFKERKLLYKDSKAIAGNTYKI